MFNAQEIVKVIRHAVIQTEIDTTRAIANQLRKLPAGFPPSEIADTLDATADGITDTLPEQVVAYDHGWYHLRCPIGRTIYNRPNADACRGCGTPREELERS